MNCRVTVLWVGLVCILLGASVLSALPAGAVGVPQMVISQLKLTSSAGQFVALYNQSGTTLDLGQFEVDYINSSGKLTSIPISGQLPANGFYMLSDDQVRLCYQMTINAVSLGFSTSGGSLQIWQISSDKTTKQLQDSVTWANKATSGAVTLPAQNSTNTVSLLRGPTDTLGNPQLAAPSGGTWQAVMPDAANPCTLDIVSTVTLAPSPVNNTEKELGTGPAAPSTIVSLANSNGESTPALPAADVGLNAPQITELLPNPAGTGNDDTDEFIELYNPNPTPFYLAGFTLQTGAATKHNYTFPDGTILPAQGFTAFYSADTGLSLSNSSGQAALLDPFGNVLGQTDVYGAAKDGQAWAFAKGAWYWTTQVTPNAANIVKQAVAAGARAKSSGGTSGKSSSNAVKGAATTTGSSDGTSDTNAVSPAPIHPYILAAIAVLAIGYGVYEYRHDLGNRIYQFRCHRAARRAAGK